MRRITIALQIHNLDIHIRKNKGSAFITLLKTNSNCFCSRFNKMQQKSLNGIFRLLKIDVFD